MADGISIFIQYGKLSRVRILPKGESRLSSVLHPIGNGGGPRQVFQVEEIQVHRLIFHRHCIPYRKPCTCLLSANHLDFLVGSGVGIADADHPSIFPEDLHPLILAGRCLLQLNACKELQPGPGHGHRKADSLSRKGSIPLVQRLHSLHGL